MRSFIILLILIINTNTYSQNARIDFCNINYDILDFQEVLNMILENEISLAKYDTIYFNTEFRNYKVEDYLLDNAQCYFKPFMDIDMERIRLSINNIEILKCTTSNYSSTNWKKPCFSVSYPIISAVDRNLVIMLQKSYKNGDLCIIKYVFTTEYGYKNNLVSRKQTLLSHLDYRTIEPELIKDIKPDKAKYDELMKKLDKGVKKLPDKK